MLGQLISLSKNGEEKEKMPVVNLHFFIGSDLFCDLRIKHSEIAPQHCLITSQNDKPALIRNLSRSIPTLVNKTEIGTNDVELKDQDIITIRHKNFKWCYKSSSEPSTSSGTSFGATSRNRKSWPLFKNKLVAVVTPQRRDEPKEVPPKKKRATIAVENTTNKKSAPKVLAVKPGLKATRKQSFGKRRSSVKNAQQTTTVEKTPKPSSNRKSVKFVDTGPQSRLGKRGWSSASTPYQRTPARQKVSVYATPPSTFKLNGKLKSILKTPSSSSSGSVTEPKYDLKPTVPVIAILTATPEVSEDIEVAENDVLRTPPKVEQPEIVMRSSRRKATIVRSPPSTPKSAIKRKKSPEEKSIEASERAAKKLKRDPPYALDPKKKAALLKCHRKSLTPHPDAKRNGKLITKFPSSFNSRLKAVSPVNIKPFSKPTKSRKSEPLQLSLAVPKRFRFGSVGEPSSSEVKHSQVSVRSQDVNKLVKKKSLLEFSSNISTSPVIRKLTRASKAAQALKKRQLRADVDDVLSALDLSRKWPPTSPGMVSSDSSQVNESNLSGFKKLFNTDKTLDARELFLENSSGPNSHRSEPLQSLQEHNENSLIQSRSKEESGSLNSFYSEGAQEVLCSDSLLSGNLSVPNYSSTSRRSLSLKGGRKCTLSPNDINQSSLKSLEEQSFENIHRMKDIVETVPSPVSRLGRRSRSFVNSSSNEKHRSEAYNQKEVNKSSDSRIGISGLFSTPLNSVSPLSQRDDSGSISNVSSVFSLGSFNSSRHKSRSSDSLSLLQVSPNSVNGQNLTIEKTLKSESQKTLSSKEERTPVGGKLRSKGRLSMRRAVLLASTPKPEKMSHEISTLTLEEKVGSLNNGSANLQEISPLLKPSPRITRSQNEPLAFEFTYNPLLHLPLKNINLISGRKKQNLSHSTSLPTGNDLSVSKNKPKGLSTSLVSKGMIRHNRKGWRRSQLNIKLEKDISSNAQIKPSVKQELEHSSQSEASGGYFGRPKSVLGMRRVGRDALNSSNSRLDLTDTLNTVSKGEGKLRESTSGNRKSVESTALLDEYSLKNLSVKLDKLSPSILKGAGKRGRPAKRSNTSDASKMSPLYSLVKTRSRSLPSSKALEKIPNDRGLTRGGATISGKKGRLCKDSEKHSPSLHSIEVDNSTPVLDSSIHEVLVSSGKRGRQPNKRILSGSSLVSSASPVTRSRGKSSVLSLHEKDGQDTTGNQSNLVDVFVSPISTKRHSSTIMSTPSEEISKEDVSNLIAPVSNNTRGRQTRNSSLIEISQLYSSKSSLNKTAGEQVIKPETTVPTQRKSKDKVAIAKISTEHESLKAPSSVKRRSRSLPTVKVEETSPKQETPTQFIRNRRSVRLETNKLESSSTVKDLTHSQSPCEADKTDSLQNESKSRKGRVSKDNIVVDETLNSPNINIASCELSMKKQNRSSKLNLNSEEKQKKAPQPKVTPTSVTAGRRSRPLSAALVDMEQDSSPIKSMPVDETPKHPGELIVNKSTGRRGRPSKVISNLEKIKVLSSIVKTRSHSLPSVNTKVLTPKQDISLRIESKRRSKQLKDISPEQSQLSSMKVATSAVDNDTSLQPLLNDKRQLRSSRLSEVSFSNHGSPQELDHRSIGRRSHSLPGDKTPEQQETMPAIKSTGKRGRPKKSSVIVDETQSDSACISGTSLNDVSEAVTHLKAVPEEHNVKVGRHSRQKLSNMKDAVLELSFSPAHSSSHNLSVHVTSKEWASSSVNYVDCAIKNEQSEGRLLDSSSDKLSRSMKSIKHEMETVTPRKRGRPSKVEISNKEVQLERSPIKRRSRSLPDKALVPKINESLGLESNSTSLRHRSSKTSQGMNEQQLGSPAINHQLFNSSGVLAGQALDHDHTLPSVAQNNGKQLRRSKSIVRPLLSSETEDISPIENERSEVVSKSDEKYSSFNDGKLANQSNINLGTTRRNTRSSATKDSLLSSSVVESTSQSVNNSFYSAESAAVLDTTQVSRKSLSDSELKEQYSVHSRSTRRSGRTTFSPGDKSFSIQQSDSCKIEVEPSPREDNVISSNDLCNEDVISHSQLVQTRRELSRRKEKLSSVRDKSCEKSKSVSKGEISGDLLKGKCSGDLQVADQSSLTLSTVGSTKNSHQRKSADNASSASKSAENKSFGCFVQDNSFTKFSPIKRRLRSGDSTALGFSSILNNSHKFTETHSSTPMVNRTSSVFFSSGIQNLHKFKKGGMRSPFGISPIVGSDESISSTDDHSRVSMICCPSSKSVSDSEVSDEIYSRGSELFPNTTFSNGSQPKSANLTPIAPHSVSTRSRKSLKKRLSEEGKSSKNVQLSDISVHDGGESDVLSTNSPFKSMISEVCDKRNKKRSTNELSFVENRSRKSSAVSLATSLRISTNVLPYNDGPVEVKTEEKKVEPVKFIPHVHKSSNNVSVVLNENVQRRIGRTTPLSKNSSPMSLPSAAEITDGINAEESQLANQKTTSRLLGKRKSKEKEIIEVKSGFHSGMKQPIEALERAAENSQNDTSSNSLLKTRKRRSAQLDQTSSIAAENELSEGVLTRQKKVKDTGEMSKNDSKKKEVGKKVTSNKMDVKNANALIEEKELSPIVYTSKTRTKVDVLALKPPGKGKHVISSPIVQSPVRTTRAGKIYTKKSAETSPFLQRKGRSRGVGNEMDESNNQKNKNPTSLPKKSKIAEKQSNRKKEESAQDASPHQLRRGRSAIRQNVIPSHTRRGKQIITVPEEDVKTERSAPSSPPKRRGRRPVIKKDNALIPSSPIRRRGKKISTELKEQNKNQKSAASPLPQKKGRAATKKDNIVILSSPKRGGKQVISEPFEDLKSQKSAASSPQRKGRTVVKNENTDIPSTPKRRGKKISPERKEDLKNQKSATLSSPEPRKRPAVRKEKKDSESKKKKDKQQNKQDSQSLTLVASPPLPKKGRRAKGVVAPASPPMVEQPVDDGKNFSIDNKETEKRRGRSKVINKASPNVVHIQVSNQGDKSVKQEKKKKTGNKRDPSPDKHSSPLKRARVENVRATSSGNNRDIPPKKGKSERVKLSPQIVEKVRKVSGQSKVIKSRKVEDKKPLKSALKKILRMSLAGSEVRRFSRKSSIKGLVKIGKKSVKFNSDDHFRFVTPESSMIIYKKRTSTNNKSEVNKNKRQNKKR